MWLCSHGNLTGEAFKSACDKYWKTFDSTQFPEYCLLLKLFSFQYP